MISAFSPFSHHLCTPTPPHPHKLQRTSSTTTNLRKVRSIEHQPHQHTRKRTRDGNGSNPRQQQEAYSLEIDSLHGTVTKTYTNCSTGDAHGCRNRERVLREEKDGNGSAHLHRRASARRVVGDLIAHHYLHIASVGNLK